MNKEEREEVEKIINEQELLSGDALEFLSDYIKDKKILFEMSAAFNYGKIIGIKEERTRKVNNF